MKYKKGDKVMILMGDDSHKTPHYLGYKGVIGTIMGESLGQWAVKLPDKQRHRLYYNPDEIELVVSPQVGDTVKVINRDDKFYEKTGQVTDIQPYLPYPWYVQFEELRVISRKPAEPKVSTAETRFPPKMAATCTMTLIDSKGQPYEALFVDVGIEVFRSYMFPEMTTASMGGDMMHRPAHIVRIDNPKWLYVTPSGSHRLVDKQGRAHYIPSGWTHLWWLPENRQQPFVKE